MSRSFYDAVPHSVGIKDERYVKSEGVLEGLNDGWECRINARRDDAGGVESAAPPDSN